MTKEELKKEAIQYAVDYPTNYGKGYKHKDLRIAYLAGAEPREKQIQIDAEQIRALQKQNGELTDELKALRESIKDYGAGCYENGLRNGKRKLEQQIEKMKCCENCGWYYLQQHWRESKEINESRMFHCGTCGNKRNWKIKEIKENDRK